MKRFEGKSLECRFFTLFPYSSNLIRAMCILNLTILKNNVAQDNHHLGKINAKHKSALKPMEKANVHIFYEEP